MPQKDFASPVRFSEKVSAAFENQKYEIHAESYQTTWGFRSTTGKYFKISNKDLATAFNDILKHWDKWTAAKLNRNSDNPDETLSEFSKKYFSAGAHKDLAEVQRRGFLHLVNAIAYSAKHDGPFSAAEWNTPLQKDDYDAALNKIRQYSENAEALSNAGDTPPQQSDGSAHRETGGDNILFYGAPGTGKSHDVWELVDGNPSFVTVFHPDMQNSDFAGTLKPGLDNEGNVTYAFRPGPFASAAAHAWANPGEKVYLVVEELNRAVAAAVFGELFQLLDRNPDGNSRYTVDYPSPEFAQWFRAASSTTNNKLALPSNLWIVATMNSADQGVYPLDTAFRRRWRQNYLPIDYGKAPTEPISIVTDNGASSISWRSFVETLNRFLVAKVEVGEDRLVGPRFVDAYDLQDGALPGKLLIYLWDDLLRHHGRSEVFAEGIRTYGDLDRALKLGKPLFSEPFLAALAVETEEAEPAPSAATA